MTLKDIWLWSGMATKGGGERWRLKMKDERWRDLTMIRVFTEGMMVATSAYEKPGERHDTDEERAGTDDAKKKCVHWRMKC